MSIMEIVKGRPTLRFVTCVPAVSLLSLLLFWHFHAFPLGADQGKPCQVSSLLNQVQPTAALISDDSQKNYVLGELAELQAKTGDFPAAFQSVAAIASQPTRDYEMQKVILIRAESGDWKGARENAEKLTDGSKRYALVQVAIAQAKAGDVQGALKSVSDLADGKESVLEVVGESQAESGDIASAMKTAEAMRNADGIFWAVATEQAKRGNVQGTLEIGARVKDEEMKGSIPEMIASSRVAAGDFEGAGRLLNRLRSWDRVRVLIELGQAQVKAGKKSEASASFDQGVQTAAMIRDVSSMREMLSRVAADQMQLGVSPTALARIEKLSEKDRKAALTGLGELLLQAGNPKDALKFLDPTNQMQLTALATAQVGDVDGALALMKSEPNSANISYWISEIVAQQAERGDTAAALKLAPKIRIRNTDYEEGYLSDALRKVARAQVKKGDLAGTLAWVNAESSPYVRADAVLGAVEGIRDLCRQMPVP